MRRRNFLVQNRAARSGPQVIERNQKEQVGDRQNSGTGSVGLLNISSEGFTAFPRGIFVFPSEESLVFPREESPDFRARHLLYFRGNDVISSGNDILKNVEVLDFQICTELRYGREDCGWYHCDTLQG